ncbi:MAG: MgtC/SapB family protein, partial [Planctomycetota bacterium]
MVWPHDVYSIILAVVFGAAIGLEREISGKAAGLRTNVLICLGAAVFTIISRQMAAGTNTAVTRIAAQVVTGVGFLGAGAIIVDRGGVHGLTTAATIWLVASIGVACGAGYYDLAVI